MHQTTVCLDDIADDLHLRLGPDFYPVKTKFGKLSRSAGIHEGLTDLLSQGT